jgi:phosphoribosyl 1,2-cyclic phosphodiesterase
MALYTTSLNSGSNGNCYYVGNEQDAVLVDLGLSCLETETRLARLGLSLKRIRAVFISHEHRDHINGLAVFSRKHKLPVYITKSTLGYGKLKLERSLIMPFQAGIPVEIGDMRITAFSKFHDAADPHSFIIEDKEVTIGVFTDIGVPCDNLRHYFSRCHAAFLESNYDEAMLINGRYPWHLKNRIRGGKGHLSNTQALELFNTHRASYLSHVFLSHLSKDNNHPDLTRDLFLPHAGQTQIVVASRYEETPVYRIDNEMITNSPLPVTPLVRLPQQPVQATLFNF